nr:putative reverse transcriptase domain-containing protein [Tanacetum cinerariifolium]
ADIKESSLIRPELVQKTTDMVVLIKEKLKAAGDCQKSYASNRHKPQEFEVGDQVLLKVSFWKDVVHFGKKEMLGPRDVGPSEIIKGIKEIKVDKTLHFVEESVKIIDREADIKESSLIRPELVQKTTDMVVLIKEKLKAAGDCQKSYASNRHKPQEFEVGDQVLLKVSFWKDVVHFGKKEMLGPRDVGPSEIIKGISPMAY